MKAFSALRLLTLVSLLPLVGVTKSSAQLFFHVVDLDSAPGVDSGSNLGVAMDALFEFNYAGSGSLRLTLTNRAGTAKNAGEGGGNYTTGILTGFGFDAPTGATYVAGSFTQALAVGSELEGGIDFLVNSPYTETNPVGNFDLGAASAPPAPANGLAAGFTAVFTWQFGGTLGYFNQTDFFSQNGSDADFGFRFQAVGTNASGSDKFVYYVDDNPPIPEPSTYGLIGAVMLIGVVTYKRVRGRKTALV